MLYSVKSCTNILIRGAKGDAAIEPQLRDAMHGLWLVSGDRSGVQYSDRSDIRSRFHTLQLIK